MEVRLPSRKNGLTWPLHPLQFLVVGVLIYFSLVWYCINVPALPTDWQPAAYTVLAVILIAHFVTYALATTINPADETVISKSRQGTSAKLDRTIHKHAIENDYCHLCECSVGVRAKHCSTCNKCVDDFDHHCIWLNNCVGRKNYRTFIVCLISGIFGTVVIATINLMQFIAYYTDVNNGDLLLPYAIIIKGDTDVISVTTQSPVSTTSTATAQFYIFFQPVIFQVFLFFTLFTAVLALIALILLCHLFIFHLYLMCRSISTYEYIVRQREKHEQEARSRETDLDRRNNEETVTSGFCVKCMNRKKGAVAPDLANYPTKEKTEHTLV